ncbi:nuclear transport factor 2 family protein [Caulobacter sp. KR2-114]|uniref:nuclear transport factor 2 family protein n=1 Tax=Caulobacter sp. KR2-114 TaxID=3400912 RepID=UPI003C0813D6
MTVAAEHDLAVRFFDAIERGDAAAVAACYAEDVAIWHNTDGLTQGRDENLKVLSGLIRYYPERRYAERRLTAFPGGFVQQHVLRARRSDGAERSLPACVICQVKDGRITRLDEYFDSAHQAAFIA